MKKYYTFRELKAMGIKDSTLTRRFYTGDPKKWGITLGKVWRIEKVVSEDAFQKHFARLIKGKEE